VGEESGKQRAGDKIKGRGEKGKEQIEKKKRRARRASFVFGGEKKTMRVGSGSCNNEENKQTEEK